MERLTETNNYIGFMETYLNVDCGKCQYKNTSKCEEFKDECRAVADFKIFVKSMYSKLKEYEDLEEQGKLLKLLCVKGNTIWFTKSAFSIAICPIEATVVAVRGAENMDVIYSAITKNKGLDRRFKNSDIGKTVFLTKPEAEQALEEIQK